MPLRVSTLARNLLRFLLTFTILNSIAAPSNGMLPIQVSSHSKVLPFFCFARWAKCVLPVPGIEPSPQDPKARIITDRPTGQDKILLFYVLIEQKYVINDMCSKLYTQPRNWCNRLGPLKYLIIQWLLSFNKHHIVKEIAFKFKLKVRAFDIFLP